MEYIQDLTLDVNSNQAYTVVSAKQGDVDSRGIRVYYTASGEEYLISTNNSVAFRVRKPDGHIAFNDTTINSDGSVTAMFTYQILAVAGRAYADLVEFSANGNTLSTVSFIIDIMASPNINADAALSSDEFLYLKSFIDRGNNIIGSAQEWANGYNGDTPVSSSNPAYNNNAKYWAEHAKSEIDEAGYLAEEWAVGTHNGQPISSSSQAYNNNSKYWSTQSKTYSDDAAASKKAIEDMTVSSETLEYSQEVSVEKTTAGDVVNLNFKIPEGRPGNAAFVTFDVDYTDGNLYMYKPDIEGLVDEVDFSINSSTGNLEVSFTSGN